MSAFIDLEDSTGDFPWISKTLIEVTQADAPGPGAISSSNILSSFSASFLSSLRGSTVSNSASAFNGLIPSRPELT